MARIRAVLFDIDGTLLDSNDAHAHSWLDALRGHGKNVPYDLVRSKIGMGGDKLLPELVGVESDSIEGLSIADRRVAIFRAHYLPDLGPSPGARALVERVRSRGLTCAVVTSATGAELSDLLRAAAVADLIDVTVTADDADGSKPDPDLVEVALERLGLGPSEAILIGDTPYDVVAARRANVPVIALRSGGWTDAELTGAVAVYENAAELATRLEESPIVRGVDDESSERATFARPAARRPAVPGA